MVRKRGIRTLGADATSAVLRRADLFDIAGWSRAWSPLSFQDPGWHPGASLTYPVSPCDLAPNALHRWKRGAPWSRRRRARPGGQSCDRVSSDLPWGATTGCDPPSEDARRLRCTSKLSDKAEGLRNLHPPVQIRAAPPFQTLMNEGTSG